MLNAISKLFNNKTETIEIEEVQEKEENLEMKRMTQMRTRITHNKLKAMAKPDENPESQNIITRAKTQELELSQSSKSLVSTQKGKSPSITMLESLEDRFSHLR